MKNKNSNNTERAVPIFFLSNINPSCQCGDVTDVQQMVMIQEVQRFEIKLLSAFLPERLVIIRGKLQSCDPNQLQKPSISASHWPILTSASLSGLVSGANFESEIGLLKAPEAHAFLHQSRDVKRRKTSSLTSLTHSAGTGIKKI